MSQVVGPNRMRGLTVNKDTGIIERIIATVKGAMLVDEETCEHCGRPARAIEIDVERYYRYVANERGQEKGMIKKPGQTHLCCEKCNRGFDFRRVK